MTLEAGEEAPDQPEQQEEELRSRAPTHKEREDELKRRIGAPPKTLGEGKSQIKVELVQALYNDTPRRIKYVFLYIYDPTDMREWIGSIEDELEPEKFSPWQPMTR